MTTNPTDQPIGQQLDPGGPPERLVVRTPQDALAAVPVMLGFEPRESVVIMTFGGRETFHARVDLPSPGDLDDLALIVDQLLQPAVHHRVAGVVLVVYAADQEWAETAELMALTAFVDAGITVHAAVRCDGSRWWAPGWSGYEDTATTGAPHDTVGHPFRAASVLRGQVVHGSRQELADLLRPVRASVAAVREARRRARTADADTVAELVDRGVLAGRLVDADLAVLLLSLRRTRGRDAAWAALTRAGAPSHVQFWIDVVQRSPADLVTAPAAVLALTAWVAGHGALAWCAVDRCREYDPGHTLAALVADLLAGAVSPAHWPRLSRLPDDPQDGVEP